MTEQIQRPAPSVGRAGPRHIPSHRKPRRDQNFRPDIEGLRAVAVLAVVFFHANVGFLSGGFVGVDVFYVISGFLITDLLWRELGRRGGLSLAGFYARRARRLLPAAMLTLVVTMVASLILLPPLEVRTVWKDGLYCGLYAGNYRFAATQTNYLANTGNPSPFQHFWSLGVEEQFYVVWPLLLVAASLVWWRRRPSRLSAFVCLGAVSFGSLLLCVWLTHANQPWAFFSLPSRAWELGLGGLIALGAPQLRRVPVSAATVVGWSGLVAIGAACLVYDSRTAFPGTAALLPVLGTGAVIASGLTSPAMGPVLLLGRVGIEAIGRISYSWYLWHWPVLILVPYMVGHTLSEWENIGLALGSGVIAILSFRFVETPTRRAPWLAAAPRRSLLTGATLSAAGVCVCLAAAANIPSVAGHGQAPVAVIRPGSGRAATGTGPSASSDNSPPTTLDATEAAFQSAQDQVETAVAASAGAKVVPANLDPSLSDASGSEPAPTVDGCLLSYTVTTQPQCLFGDTAATRSIVLFGDSHASMWFPSVDAFADSQGYRLFVWTKATCPPVDISFFSPVLGRTFTESAQWRTNVLADIASTHPTLVVLAIAPNYDSAYGVVQNGSPWLTGSSQVISAIRSSGSKVLLMGSVPSPPEDIPDCLSAHLDDATACDFPRVGHRISGGGLDGIDIPGMVAEEAAAQGAGATYANVEPWFCTETTCVSIVDNLLVYRDGSHITVPFAMYLAPLVGDEMTEALAARP